VIAVPPLADQIAQYSAYHRHPRNRVTHYVGVPVIVFSLLVPMGWLRLSLFGLDLSLAMLFAAVVLGFYFVLNVPFAIVLTFIVLAILAAAEWVATQLPVWEGFIVTAVAFTGGWALQFIGHIFEGRRPAMVDNIWQIFVAPIFLTAEVFFALGYDRELRRRVENEREKFM